MENIHSTHNHKASRDQQYIWASQARNEQLPPPGNWNTWVVLAGRGFGKTRTGAETLRQWIQDGQSHRIALIGETEKETRQVMVEGPSGVLAVHPPETDLSYEPSRRQITWPNGAIAQCYSGDKPDQLRGPQFDTAWIDEFAKFQEPQKTWEQLMFCLRLGDHPRVIVTTTPRPDPFLRELLGDEETVVTRGSTFANRSNLSPIFLKMMERKYMNTRLGRQELMAEVLEEDQDALWSSATIKAACDNYSESFLQRIVVAIDPAVSNNEDSDETGIIVAGKDEDLGAVVLEDLSLKCAPYKWAQIAVEAYRTFKADRIVAEVNMGGDLVEQMVRSVDRTVSYRAVRATRGKVVRAEPVAALYEQGRVTHAKSFPHLEKQMTSHLLGFGGKSPDRVDALVWALTELLLTGSGDYGIESLGFSKPFQRTRM